MVRIAIASGKGGTGKTFVSTNLFQLFRDSKKNSILVDCDTEAPNDYLFFDTQLEDQIRVTDYRPIIHSDKCLFCGKCVDYCSYNALFFVPKAKKISLLKDLCHGCGACQVACENGAIEGSHIEIGKVNLFSYHSETCLIQGKMKTKNNSSVPVIKKAVKVANQLSSDYMLLDSPPGTSCPFIETASSADLVLLVTEPTPFGLSDLKQSVETLNELGKPYAVIVNRSDLGNDEVYHYLDSHQIDLVTKIPFSRGIAEKYAQGDLALSLDEKLDESFISIMNYIMQYENSCSKR